MPLVTAQSSNVIRKQQPVFGLYTFAPQHKMLWKEFWSDMDGDKEKIIGFAEKAKIENPEDWYNTLTLFLFDVYGSDPKVSKTAASASFQKFLEQIAENHIKEPKPKDWYTNKGVTETGFIRWVERAALFEDSSVAMKYLNAKIVSFGSDIYSEYLLTKAPGEKEIKSIASQMNKKAYELEKAHGIDILESLRVGSLVQHELFPNETFEVVGFCKRLKENLIEVIGASGNRGYVRDRWNLSSID